MSESTGEAETSKEIQQVPTENSENAEVQANVSDQ